MAEKVPLELGTEKIGKLLKRYAMPAVIAMTASSLYNMIDCIFIGQGCGPMAISGLALTFPIMNLSTAFGTLVGVGAATLMSVLLGQKNYTIAKKVLSNVLFLNIIIALLFSFVTLVFLDRILFFFGASENTLPYAKAYLIPILAGNVITHLYFGLNAIVRVTGHPQKAMYATLFTVALNTALDPVFIFALDMGIQGAAVATVISQFISFLWVMKILCDKRELVHFEKSTLSLDWKIAKRSLSIGLAPFLMNSAACFVVIFINIQMKKYGGDLQIGAYGIVNRIVFLFIMIILGITQGMQPIAGYNYGAKQYSRVTEVFNKTVLLSSLVTCSCFAVAMICPRAAVSLFTKDEQLTELAVHGFRIMVVVFPIVGRQMVVSSFFQSLGLVKSAIFLSLSRQLLFLIPGLIFLPMLFGADGAWMSMPVSDFITVIISEIMMYSLMKQFKADKESGKAI